MTDAAEELHALAEKLAAHRNNKGTVLEVLASIIQIEMNDPNFLEIVAATKGRITSLIELANDIKDADFSEQMRKEVLSACGSFRGLFDLKFANNHWAQRRPQCLPDANRNSLRILSVKQPGATGRSG